MNGNSIGRVLSLMVTRRLLVLRHLAPWGWMTAGTVAKNFQTYRSWIGMLENII